MNLFLDIIFLILNLIFLYWSYIVYIYITKYMIIFIAIIKNSEISIFPEPKTQISRFQRNLILKILGLGIMKY